MNNRPDQPNNERDLREERADKSTWDYRWGHLFVQKAEAASEIDARIRADWYGGTSNSGASSAYLNIWRNFLWK